MARGKWIQPPIMALVPRYSPKKIRTGGATYRTKTFSAPLGIVHLGRRGSLAKLARSRRKVA